MLCLGWFFLAGIAATNATAAPRRVLILYSFGHNFSPNSTVGASLQTELAQELGEPVEFHEASLEMPRLVAGESPEAFVAYLQARFGNQEPDLIVPLGAPAVKFALEQRSQLFPRKPLLLGAVEARHLQSVTLDSKTTAVPSSFDLPALLEDALRLQPGTKHVAVVLGSSRLEDFWKAETKRQFQRFTNAVSFTWLDGLSLPQMAGQLGHMPPHSLIFFIAFFVDAAGVPFEKEQAMKVIHDKANAPIFGLFEEDLGLGVVGGSMLNLREQGRETARVARRILSGESPASIHVPPSVPGKPVYDWRELKQWGIAEKQLPAGSEVRFRQPSTVQQYRWRIVGVLSVAAAEAVLILALVRELRHRRETELSLRESQERMKLATSAAKLRLWDWDMINDQIQMSRHDAATEFVGSLEDVLRDVHPDDRKEMQDAVVNSIAGNGEYHSIQRVKTRRGEWRWIAVRGRVEFDQHRTPLRMRGISMDITARKEAEERARESEGRFMVLANSAPMLIWASGADKLCTFVNQAWLDFTGRRIDQELGDGWLESVHQEDAAGSMKLYVEAFDARRPFTMQYRLRRHDGEYRWVSDHGVPRYDRQRNFVGYIGSCMDISDGKKAEAEAERSRDELAHMTRVATLGELGGSLAHELNQPLTAILSNAQAASRFLDAGSTNDGEVREILRDIVAEDLRAGEIIVRIRSMLKKQEPKLVPDDLNEIVREVIQMMRSELVVRNVTLRTRLAANLPLVRGDRVRLQQVLLNLIVNACDAMEATPRTARQLTIETQIADKGFVQVSVSDQGTGFPVTASEPIFEPFRTTKPNGLGLGLPICRSLIELHGGRLWAGNSSGGGATVRFTVKAAQEVPA